MVRWLFAPALIAAAVLTACGGAVVTEEQLTEVSSEQRTLAREVATFQREVEGLTGGEPAAATTEHGAPAAAPDTVHEADAAPHFTYAGATGPDVWGTLSQDWEMCGTGSSQSPVNIKIDDSTPIGLNDVVFDYQPSDVTLINNGHTIQGNVTPGSTIVVDGEIYDLLQFHFHEPSEHELGGSPAALEAHFVHRNAAGTLAVVGVLFQLGAHNASLDAVWASLPQTTEDESHIGVFAQESMLPLDRSAYRYAGSLTTPPCSEGVKWHVLTSTLTASAEQAQTFLNIIGENARPVQPLNGRSVLADVTRG